MKHHFIPKHGGYKNLLSHQKAEIIYDATVYFTNRFYKKGDRTIDQMVQAARSGKQNIIEASLGSATSKEFEIKLTNVARASQEELLADYRDFLRRNNYEEWSRDHYLAKRLRELIRLAGKNATYDFFRKAIENDDPCISANAIIGLIKVTNYLLNKQLIHLEQDFLTNGGLRERMTNARINAKRDKRDEGTEGT